MTEPLTRSARILLVEDETDVLRANERYLSGKGYDIRCAETLEAAWNSLWESPPDLILLDVMLPDGSGYAFCEKLRGTSSVPVIFLTAKGDEANIVGGLSLGGDDYIVKPYSMEVLGARVAAQLRRRGAGLGEISLPPLHIDMTAGIVRLDGEEIPLSRREFQLLAYFAERQGQELRQPEIYRAVWGGDEEEMGSVVRVTVSRLRQKLRLNAGSCFELSATASQSYIFLRVCYPESR